MPVLESLKPASLATAPLALCIHSVAVMVLPALLGLLTSPGEMRLVAVRWLPLTQLVNATVMADGRIVRARADGGLVVTGRRDRLALALLPRGMVALPAMVAGFSTGGER